MKIILKKNYPSLGKKGEIKEVAQGFACNFLIPQKIAIEATEANVSQITTAVEQESKTKKITEKKLSAIYDQINNLSLKIMSKADKSGKLFGAVGKSEIQQALLSKIKVKIPKTKIDLKKSIKSLGQYKINIQTSPESKAKVKLEIVGKEKVKAKK